MRLKLLFWVSSALLVCRGESVLQAQQTQLYLYNPTQTQQLNDHSFLGAGARARGMGGAFYGVSDDPSAASWNPAGLVFINKPQTGLSYFLMNFKNNYDQSYSAYNINRSASSSLDKNMLTYFSFVLPFKIKQRQFYGSALFHRISDIRSRFEVPNFTDSIYLASKNRQFIGDISISREGDGSLNLVNLAVATDGFENISFGAALNIFGGGFKDKIQWSLFADHPGNLDDTLYYLSNTIDGDYSGFNGVLSAMYRAAKFRMGVLAKLPWSLKEKDDVSNVYKEIIRGIENTPAYNGLLYITERRWKFPLVFGFGASYRAAENFLLAADFDLKNFSSTELVYQVNYLNPNSPDTTVDLGDTAIAGWKDLNQFRIGAEYVVTTKYGKVPIRAGYRNDPKVLFDIDSTSVNPLGESTSFRVGKQVKGSVFSLGTGIHWSQIMLDLSFEFGSFDLEEKGSFNTGYVSSTYSVKNDFKTRRIMLNFTGIF